MPPLVSKPLAMIDIRYSPDYYVIITEVTIQNVYVLNSLRKKDVKGQVEFMLKVMERVPCHLCIS